MNDESDIPVKVVAEVEGQRSLDSMLSSLDELTAKLSGLKGRGSHLKQITEEFASVQTSLSQIKVGNPTAIEELKKFQKDLDTSLEKINQSLQKGVFGKAGVHFTDDMQAMALEVKKVATQVVNALEVEAARIATAAKEANMKMSSALMLTPMKGVASTATHVSAVGGYDSLMNTPDPAIAKAREHQLAVDAMFNSEQLKQTQRTKLEELNIKIAYARQESAAKILEEEKVAAVQKQTVASHVSALNTQLTFIRQQSAARIAEEERVKLVQQEAVASHVSALNNQLNFIRQQSAARVAEEQRVQAELKAVRDAAYADQLSKIARMAAIQMNQSAPVGNYSIASGSNIGKVVSQAQTVTTAAPKAPAPIYVKEGASQELAAFNGHLKDTHSLARGVASGFNAMWLTWGNIVPLLAGAAISNSFMSAMKLGFEVSNTLSTIQALAGASTEEIGRLNTAIVQTGLSTQFGPEKTIEALKTLSLAGLDATQSLQALRPVLEFSIAGEMPIAKSAESLIAISTAFGFASTGIATVGDIIAKTAAVSMASTDGMTESFRAASVVAQQYGVSIDDAAASLGFLSQIGIKGSAAGTAMKNLYTELMSGSLKTRKALAEVGVQAIDTVTGNAKPLIEIITAMEAGLRKFDAIKQQSLLGALANNRGSKLLVAALQEYRQSIVDTNPVFAKHIADLEKAGKQSEAYALTLKHTTNAFEEMQRKIADAPGFAILAAADKSVNPAAQFDAIKASLQTGLLVAFESTSNAVTELLHKVREFVSSPDFIQGISSMVAVVTNLASAFISVMPYLVSMAELYAVAKVGMIAYTLATAGMMATNTAAAGSSGLLSIATGVLTTAQITGTAATIANATASAAVAAAKEAEALALGTAVALKTTEAAAAYAAAVANTALAEATAAATAASTAFTLTPLGIVLVGLVGLVAAGAAAWLLFADHTNTAKDAEGRLVKSFSANKIDHDNYVKTLDESIRTLDDRIDAIQKNITADEQMTNKAGEAAMERLRNMAKESEAEMEIRLSRAQSWDAIFVGASTARVAEAALHRLRMDNTLAIEALESKQGEARSKRALIDAHEREQARIKATRPIGEDPGAKKVTPAYVPKEKFHADNATAELNKRYADEYKLLADKYANEQKLLDESLKLKLITEGEYYGRDFDLQQRAQAAKLQALADHQEAAQGRYKADIAKLLEHYEKQRDAALASKHADEGVAAALLELTTNVGKVSEAYNTFTEQLENTAEKVKDGTYTKLASDMLKIRASIKATQDASNQAARDEKTNLDKLTKARELDNRVRSATPEAAARIQAEAAEEERLLPLLNKHEEAVASTSEKLSNLYQKLEGKNTLTAKEAMLVAALVEQLEAEKVARDGNKEALERQVAAAGQNAALRIVAEERDKFVSSIADSVVLGLFEGGAAGRASLRKLIVDELRKPITIMVKASVSAVMDSMTGFSSMTGSNSGSGIGGVARNFNGAGLSSFANSSVGEGLGLSHTVYDSSADTLAHGLTDSGSMLSSMPIGGILTAYQMGGAGGFVAGVASTALAGGVSAMAAGTSALAGASAALAAIPVYGWIALGAAALMGGQKFTSSSNIGDRSSSYAADGKLTNTSSGFVQSKGADDYVSSIRSSYEKTAKQLGAKTIATEIGYGSTNGREAANPNFRLQMLSNGKQLMDTVSDNPELHGVGLTSLTPENMSLQANRAILAALQASELPKHLAGVFDGIDANTASAEAISGYLSNATALNDFHTQLTALPFQSLTDMGYEATKTIIDLSGGLNQFASNLSSFYNSFYSGTQKASTNVVNLTRAFFNMGKPMLDLTKSNDEIRESYRLMVETSMNDVTPAGLAATAALLALAPSIDALVPATASTQTAFEQFMSNGAKLAADALNWDGSLESAERLNGSMIGMFRDSLVLVQMIRDMATAAKAEFAGMRETILLDTMNNSQKYQYFSDRVEANTAKLALATDPAEIQRLTTQINKDAMSAWSLLSAEEKQSNLQKFQGWIDKVEALTLDRFAKAEKTVTDATLDQSNKIATIFNNVMNEILARDKADRTEAQTKLMQFLTSAVSGMNQAAVNLNSATSKPITVAVNVTTSTAATSELTSIS